MFHGSGRIDFTMYNQSKIALILTVNIMSSVGDSNPAYTIETLDLDFSKKKHPSVSKCYKNAMSDRKNIPTQNMPDIKT